MSNNQRRNNRNKQGGSQSGKRKATRKNTQTASVGVVHHRPSTETKSSLKTTELIAYAGAVLAVIMTALAVDAGGQTGEDPFGAESAIRYITYLTIGYMLARGLAKFGSHENRVAHDSDIDDDSGGDRRASNADVAETAGEPAEQVQPAAAEDVDVRS